MVVISSVRPELSTWKAKMFLFLCLLFDGGATYISDGIINYCGVGHLSARSSSIKDEASKRRSKESSGSSHAGEHPES